MQNIIVYLILAIAVVLTLLWFVRRVRNRNSGCNSGCSGGCSRSKKAECGCG